MNQTMEFSAKDLSPIAYKSTMQMGPQSTGAEFVFTSGAVSGTVLTAGSPEPKEIAFDFVDGTILDSALEFAIGCLPLAVGKTYRFPVVDSQTGSLQTVRVKILEMVTLDTPAGSFNTYKVRVQRPAGEAFMYVGEDAPHILVKQEVPAQAMSIELKSLAN